ncbi:hypothetical protein IGI04_035805 [Brassica rapa subsp. trilocularis]|uniref:Uncharacterized protein n=1 Tax=Brassica rapa subsp. trilocularis TaxID=1813537 RepID=A0ABQ7LEH8_BRACM|nr:hypothetical protein IGI04_035805 [Brassica rapa subsp. trilocularis]
MVKLPQIQGARHQKLQAFSRHPLLILRERDVERRATQAKVEQRQKLKQYQRKESPEASGQGRCSPQTHRG